jgi:hypothetical protein
MNTALLLLPDFALILLGTAIRRWMHLGDHFWSGVEKLVYFILFRRCSSTPSSRPGWISALPCPAGHGVCGNGRRHGAGYCAKAVPACRR